MKSPPFRRIVVPLAIAETVIWAAIYYLFPALLSVWERSLGWSKTELSGAFTLALVVSAVLAPVAGRLIDHGLSRHALGGGALLSAVLLALLSQVTALWQFYAVWLGLGVAMAFTLYEPCFAVLIRSLGVHAGRAITLVTLVAGFAGTVSFPSANTLAGVLGWRGAVAVFAFAVALVAAPLIYLGCQRAERHGHAEVHVPPSSKKALQAIAAARTSSFWMLAAAFTLIAVNHGIIITHILPLLEDRGIQAGAAVLAASMIGPMQVCGRLALMAVERRIPMSLIAVCCYVAMGFAAGALLVASRLPALVLVFVFLQGAGYGITSIVRPVITAELFGRRNFGIVAGVLAVPFVGGTAVAPILAALTWLWGGYDLVLILAISCAALGLLALLMAWRYAA